MFSLPKLPYDYDALEPHLDAQTMELHHTKHHQAYVDKLNAALQNSPDLFGQSVEQLLKGLSELPAEVMTAVRNHGGGHYNHSLFWQVMKPTNEINQPTGALAMAIEREFGNFAKFQEEFSASAAEHFGSGWAWLIVNTEGQLQITSTPNQDNPLMTGLVETLGQPILGLDVWEHAYYLKYQNRRSDYITVWWNVINWPQVEQNYQMALTN